MSDIKIYRCYKCGQDLDTDLKPEPRMCCRNCGSRHWDEQNAGHLLTKRDVYILYRDTGMWIKNVTGETWIDRKIQELFEITPQDRQDRAEAEFAQALKDSVELPFDLPGDVHESTKEFG